MLSTRNPLSVLFLALAIAPVASGCLVAEEEFIDRRRGNNEFFDVVDAIECEMTADVNDAFYDGLGDCTTVRADLHSSDLRMVVDNRFHGVRIDLDIREDLRVVRDENLPTFANAFEGEVGFYDDWFGRALSVDLRTTEQNAFGDELLVDFFAEYEFGDYIEGSAIVLRD